jgi:hypothetical protein
MHNQATRVAIVGCGPFGLCAFERLHATASREDARQRFVVHVVDPHPPGVGVYAAELPEYLLLNTACGQIDLFASKISNPELAFASPRPSFFEWLQAEGYRVKEYALADGSVDSRPVRRSDYLPRRWLGRYLQAVFQTLVRTLPPNLELRVHARRAVRVVALARGERVLFEGGGHLDVDYAFLTLGHGDAPAEQSQLCELTDSGERAVSSALTLGTCTSTALAGFGLTAIDAIAHVTLGTGGRFVRRDGALHYVPSGREPRLFQFSRSGTAYRTRPHGSGAVERGIGETTSDACALRQLSRARGKLDFRAAILPFVLREMGTAFEAAREATEGRERFDASEEIFGECKSFANGAAYQEFLARSVIEDIDESRRGTAGSAKKAGIESLRGLRELIRDLVDFGGLTGESFRDFRRSFVPNVYRLIVGAPTQKMEEWLALRRAGLLCAPLGPRPRVTRAASGWTLDSTALKQGVSIEATRYLRGFAPGAPAVMERSSLVRALLDDGRVRPLDPSGALGCGLDLDASFHPVTRSGSARRLFVLGLLSEGARSFNLYVPSPGSRFRAFTDAQACVDEIVNARVRAETSAARRRAP